MAMAMVVEIDGDGSGGTSPSRQGAGTETSIPRISPSVAAALRTFLWIFDCRSRVFSPGDFYRRTSEARRQPGGPHPLVARPGWARATLGCDHPGALLRLCF